MTNDELERLFYRQTEHIKIGKDYSNYEHKEYLRPEIPLIFAGLMETAYFITVRRGKYDVWGVY
ncbi:hypothetical protein LCGC14_2786310 [marine sediment metagenome]|uniref:Uncharacterized protein n=1 Tax=marine sediment metagenome TaxID=412755 RepID=A0A0F8YRU7_9ZZZZ